MAGHKAQDNGPADRPVHERVREAVMGPPDPLESLLSFLTRLGRFGLVAGMPPLLGPFNPGS